MTKIRLNVHHNCPNCGKVKYTSKVEAEGATAGGATHLYAYLDKECGVWHTTHYNPAEYKAPEERAKQVRVEFTQAVTLGEHARGIDLLRALLLTLET